MSDAWLLPTLLVVPLVGAIVMLIAGATAERWATTFGLIVQSIGLAITLLVVANFSLSDAATMQMVVEWSWIPELAVDFRLGVDGISLPLVVLTSLLGWCAAVYTFRHLPEPGRARGFVGLLLLLQVGMVGTFLALDLILFFLFFEVVLIPMWFVIAFWGSGPRRRAANTFILYTVLGSVVMVVGFLIVIVQTGSSNMVELASGLGAEMSSGVQLTAALLILVGLAVKTPMWPLHTWLPDAHTAAPTVGSVLLAGVLLKMGTYGMVRIVLPVLPDAALAVAPFLGAFAVVGILYGAVASYGQNDLKRVIAFSSVGHMGFVLLGISTLSIVGVNAALFGNVAHGLITGLLFFLVGSIKERTGATSFTQLPRALYTTAPRLGFLLGFAAIASLGLPGLAGFWGEFLALVGAYHPLDSGARLFYRVLLVLGAVGMVLAAAYFVRVLRRVGQGEAPPQRFADVRPREWLTWTPLVLLTLVLGLAPIVLLEVTDPSVRVVVESLAGALS
ncbi:MAG TPA: NADH-quinone oxidoreductase subunit M [Actinomycetes bacterium]|nr:NADH-quinone oxidoreductase subunit M [Actinomycetes bacterium]